VKLQRACRDEGVIVRNLGRGVAVSPPLVAAEPELDLLAALAEGFGPLGGAGVIRGA